MTFDLNSLIRDSVKDLKPYSSARDDYVSDGTNKIFLDANENPFENGLNRYPDPRQRTLKSMFANFHSIPEEQILLGNGSDEVLDLIFRAFCEPRSDNVITIPPTYGMYKVLAGINDVENREVVLDPTLQLDVDRILARTDAHTKLIFICSPNNPTGNRFEDGDIELILRRFNGILVLDEAYIHFSKGKTWMEELENYPNLIVTHTLSKAYGLAGIRLGICYASAEIISILNRIKPPYNVNELTQKSAMRSLENKKTMTEQVARIIKERDRLVQEFSFISFISEVFPTDANFILVQVDDADMRYRQILDRGIVVRNRSTLPRCENSLRFTVGTVEENNRLLSILKSI